MDKYSTLMETLSNACSQNTELIKIAEHQLKCWETEPMFFSVLLDIACNQNNDVNFRWMAVMLIKNGVDRYWRKTAQYSIDLAERKNFKQKLLLSIAEPDNRVAIQFVAIISKIARHDFPNEWQELFPSILDGIQAKEDFRQSIYLLALHHVIKTLASKRLLKDIRIFQQLTSEIFTMVVNHWITHSNSFFEEVRNGSIRAKDLLYKSFLTLKVLRNLVVNGFKDIAADTNATNFLVLIFQQILPFLECRANMSNNEFLLERCEKYLILLTKILYDVLEHQPFSYIQFITPTFECCTEICFKNIQNIQGKISDRLLVQCMNLMKGILICPEYVPTSSLEASKNLAAIKVPNFKRAYFTEPILKEIFEQLISRYFLLSEEELAIWENSPEEFASEEFGESWKFSLRPCSETFFLSIFHEFRSAFIPLVIDAVKNMQTANVKDFKDILKKDAVYNAVGLSAFDLYDDVDFDSWFSNHLLQELEVKEIGYRIIRRRVLWMIGQWVPVKFSPDRRPFLYEALIRHLDCDEDLIVRLSAANAFKMAVDDFDFDCEKFRPYLERSVTGLFNLLKDVDECYLKMSVLHVLTFIIKAMGADIRPHIEVLMQYLPHLWENCGEHNMLQCAIAGCFVHIVECLGTLSENSHLFLLPMIAYCTDVSQPQHVYLLEDGLDLWWAVLDNTATCSEQLLSLALYLVPLLELQGETLKMCLKITEAYIILVPEVFLQRYGETIVKIFHSELNDMKEEALDLLLQVFETAFRVSPEQCSVLFRPIMHFVVSRVQIEIEKAPLDGVKHSPLHTYYLYFCLLSHVILHDQVNFGSFLEECAKPLHENVEIMFAKILDVWLKSMTLFYPYTKTIRMALALTCLLTSNSDIVHHRICDIITAVVEVMDRIFLENCSFKPDDELITDLFVKNCNVEEQEGFQQSDDDFITEHNRRVKEHAKIDPVETVNLSNYFCSQVVALKQSVGETKFNELMSTVDIEIIQQMRKYLHFEYDKQDS